MAEYNVTVVHTIRIVGTATAPTTRKPEPTR
jgi:hypothetical protein